MTDERDSPPVAETDEFYETYGWPSELADDDFADDDDDGRMAAFVAVAMPYLRADLPGSPYSARDRAQALRASELSYEVDELAYDGHHEDALEIAQEVVRIYRDLVEIDPENNRPLLAIALSTLSAKHLGIDRPGPALRAAEDASVIYRELAESQPSQFLSDLAGALNDLGVRYADHERPLEALAATEESARIYRQLAAGRPVRYRDDLATALADLIRRYGALGRFSAALGIAEEATQVCRRLVESDPATHRPDLADALLSTAWICAQGRLDPARGRPAAQEAADLLAELSRGDPSFTGPRNTALALMDRLAGPLPP